MASRQQQLINSGFLDLTGESRLDYGPVSLDSLTEALAAFALEYAELAREKLDKVDRTASGHLSDSIIPTRVTIMGKTYKVDIKLANYYDFVNQGVKGWADEKGGNSPYQFKRYQGKSGMKSGKMVTAIRKWIIKEGLKGRGKENAHPKATRRDQTRAKITDTSTRTAIIISKSVRKKGLKPSHFWTDTQKEMQGRIKDALGKALKVDIINNIIPNGNSNK
jgi:hypothetical protein